MSGTRLTEEPESEGYFASVSDLMVGILFVFLLMLTVFALNFRDDSARLDELIARAERAEQAAQRAEQAAQVEKANAEAARAEAERQLAEAERQSARARLQEEEAARLRAQNEVLRARLQEAADKLRRELADREAARNALLDRLARGLEARRIQFILDPRSGVLRLSDAVPFPTGGSELTDTARRTVTALGEVLADVLPCFSHGAPRQNCDLSDIPILEAMLVEGHTDRQPFLSLTAAESLARNDLLSTARALTVFAHLRQQQRILDDLRNPSDQPLLGVSGYGQRRPLPEATTLSEAHLAQNRRIDLRFILSARTSDEIRRLLEDIAALQRSEAR
jgi:flagellar motor protein MotB